MKLTNQILKQLINEVISEQNYSPNPFEDRDWMNKAISDFNLSPDMQLPNGTIITAKTPDGKYFLTHSSKGTMLSKGDVPPRERRKPENQLVLILPSDNPGRIRQKTARIEKYLKGYRQNIIKEDEGYMELLNTMFSGDYDSVVQGIILAGSADLPIEEVPFHLIKIPDAWDRMRLDPEMVLSLAEALQDSPHLQELPPVNKKIIDVAARRIEEKMEAEGKLNELAARHVFTIIERLAKKGKAK
jgi:hypothetical protein